MNSFSRSTAPRSEEASGEERSSIVNTGLGITCNRLQPNQLWEKEITKYRNYGMKEVKGIIPMGKHQGIYKRCRITC